MILNESLYTVCTSSSGYTYRKTLPVYMYSIKPNRKKCVCRHKSR